MKKIRTYCDANILITASRYTNNKYLEILDDPNREFASSPFAKLETLPKAIFHKYSGQVEFLESFFTEVPHWPNSQDLELIVDNAFELAKNYNLNAVDALHCACAIHLKCAELFTQEKPDKPMHQVIGLKITYIQPPDIVVGQ